MSKKIVIDKKAIVLCGAGKTGKTTTLKLVIEKLKKAGFSITKGKISPVLSADCILSLEKNGKTIVVNTAGDNKGCVNRIKEYEKESFDDGDLYILASRSRNNCESVNEIRSIFVDESNIIWNFKWRVTSLPFGSVLQEKINDLQAEEIVREALWLL